MLEIKKMSVSQLCMVYVCAYVCLEGSLSSMKGLLPSEQKENPPGAAVHMAADHRHQHWQALVTAALSPLALARRGFCVVKK